MLDAYNLAETSYKASVVTRDRKAVSWTGNINTENSMENPYLPPKSEVSSQAIDKEKEPSSENKTIRIAMIMVAAIDTVSALYGYFVSDKYDLLYTVLSCIIVFMFSWYLVVVIHKMANGLGANGKVRKFGIWSFVWRSYIAKYASIVLAVLVLVAFHAGSKSIQMLIISTIILVFVSPIVVWALFSNNRRAQIQWISATLSRF